MFYLFRYCFNILMATKSRPPQFCGVILKLGCMQKISGLLIHKKKRVVSEEGGGWKEPLLLPRFLDLAYKKIHDQKKKKKTNLGNIFLNSPFPSCRAINANPARTFRYDINKAMGLFY